MSYPRRYFRVRKSTKVRKYFRKYTCTVRRYFRNGLLPEIDTIQYYVHVHYNVVLSYIVHTRVKYESTKVPSYDKQLLINFIYLRQQSFDFIIIL